MGKGLKGKMWKQIADKMDEAFTLKFAPTRVARKWEAIVTGYKNYVIEMYILVISWL